MANGRCYNHGGKSTGAKTAEGRERQQRARLKHGEKTQQALAERRSVRELIRNYKQLMKERLLG